MTVVDGKVSARLRSIAPDAGAALASAALLWAAFAPLALPFFAWVGLVPLLCRIGQIERTRRAAVLGYVTGLLFFLLGFHWLFFATTGGYVVVCLILALYWALFAALVHRLRRSGPVRFVIGVALLFTGTEFVRGIVLGGFPWLNLGHSQAALRDLCQLADITGVAGVTAWVVLINATVAQVVTVGRGGLRAVALTMIVLVAVFAYGTARLAQPLRGESIRVALVQSNHVHHPDGSRTVKQEDQIAYLLDRSKAIEGVDLIAWPETTMPPLNIEARTEPGLGGAPFFSRTLEQLATLAADRDASIVTGGYFVGGFQGELGKRRATDIRNSVYHLSRDGELVGRYDKIRLVPFAEYIPFQESGNWMHRVMTRFATAAYAGGYRLTPAQERVVFQSGSIRFVTPICFEDTVAPLVRSFFKPEPGSNAKRADLIVNISNDGWFNAAEKRLHLQIAVFRSIEHRVPTARVSNTGQSAFIDSTGRVTSALDPFSEGVLVGEARLDPRLTLYTRFGEAFAWACVVGSAGLLTWRPGKRATPSAEGKAQA